MNHWKQQPVIMNQCGSLAEEEVEKLEPDADKAEMVEEGATLVDAASEQTTSCMPKYMCMS